MYKHLTKLSLAGVVALAQLTGGIVFQAQLIGRAIAQITRCPCYNEMVIVGVCGLDPTCIRRIGPQSGMSSVAPRNWARHRIGTSFRVRRHHIRGVSFRGKRAHSGS